MVGWRLASRRSAAKLAALPARSSENVPGATSWSQPQRVCEASPVNSTGPRGVRAMKARLPLV